MSKLDKVHKAMLELQDLYRVYGPAMQEIADLVPEMGGSKALAHYYVKKLAGMGLFVERDAANGKYIALEVDSE